MRLCGRALLLLAALVASAGAFSVSVPGTGSAARGLLDLRPRTQRSAPPVVRAVGLDGVHAQSAQVRPAAPDADALFAAAVSLYEQVRDDDLARVSAAPGRKARLVEAARLLDRVFELDHAAAVAAIYGGGGSAAGARQLTNLTCVRPANAANRGPAAPQLFDQDLVALPLERGRACVCGGCSPACSRVLMPGLVAEEEADALVELAARHLPGLEEDRDAEFAVDETLHLKFTAAIGDLALHLLYVRLVERVRRVVAVEYGVALQSLSVRSSFVSRIKAGKNPRRYSMLHVDEGSTFTFHYSSVIYLSSQPAAGGGGDFVFSDARPSPGPAASTGADSIGSPTVRVCPS